MSKIQFDNMTHIEIADRLNKQEQTIRNKAKRVEVIAAGGNCLTCKHTKITLGKRLQCKLKDKLVTQYNYCEKYIALAVISTPEIKSE